MIANAFVGLLVIGYILYRQMRPTPVGRSPKTALILCIVGAFIALKGLENSAFTAADIAILAASTVLGLAIAVVRGNSVQIYRDPATGVAIGRGTAVTGALWLLGIATHIGMDAFATAGLGGTTLLFYLGSVLLVQNLVVTGRARRAGLPIATAETATGEKDRSVSVRR